MFGARPVGHVMDPQFKPLFWGVMEICMQMQVCSINLKIQYAPLKCIQIANIK